MLKLPVCPHCGAVYRYKDTQEAIRKKTNECYHCHQKFRVKLFPYVLIEGIVLAAVCVFVNLMILSRLSSLQLIPLFAVTVVFLLIIYLLAPLFTHFKKEEKTEKKKK